MKKTTVVLLITLSFLASQLFAQESIWKIVPGKITTPWAAQVNPQQPLPEYPRPQLARAGWQNLNGIWQYAIVPGESDAIPSRYDGEILVPYPVESALSGVGKTVDKENTLWYRTEMTLDKSAKNKKIILHFGAVDWRTIVYINGRRVGSHEGGYDPFSFDITRFLKKGNKQEIVVSVWDPSDEGPQPRGKQVRHPEGIWYTPVTGIWQTVWVEAVPQTYIVSTKNTVDFDRNTLRVETQIEGAQPGDELYVAATRDGTIVGEQRVSPGSDAVLTLQNPEHWSPSNPFLYGLQLKIIRNSKTIDNADSYFAFRKISVGKDGNGIQRMLLNNKFVFQYGPLDQGWWPDGLYTAPTDEALLFDIQKTKAMGFNVIRKHVKVEPARWYYHCDQEGILVWQDMPSGDMGGNHWDMRPGIISGKNHDKTRSAASEAIYKKEWKSIMDALYNFPSIIVWVPFNEAWGQFKTEAIAEWTRKNDPTRLVNSASGGNFFKTGDILDIHNYPDPFMPRPDIFGHDKVLVLGEFGGLGLPLEGHTWQDKNNWGYQSFKNTDELRKRYEGLISDLNTLIPLGLSAAVYTQTTDVEVEVNGLMTYDREVIKMGEKEIRDINKKLHEHIID